MSGGVDSSVAAFLLREEGFEVTGVTMRLWVGCPEDRVFARKSCCSLEDIKDAVRVAKMLGVEHLVVDMRREFFAKVVEPFVEDYCNGRTPNPCVLCNRYVKLELLSAMAANSGCSYLATGHYARVVREGAEFRLLKGIDEEKDQSYFLYRLNQEILSKLILPNGSHHKREIVGIARDLRMEVSEKEESQEICFVPGGDYRAFLRRHFPQVFKPGPILDTSGKLLGKHGGIAGYTIGQRRGLGISHPHPLYVVALDPRRNAVIVGRKEEAEGRSVLVGQVSWVKGKPPQEEFDARIRIRYNMKEVPGKVRVLGMDSIWIFPVDPLWAITPGQSAVIYQGDEVLGGGVIEGQSPEA